MWFKVPEGREVSFGGIIPSPKKSNRDMITGNWRSRRPVWKDEEKCDLCRNCYIWCPEGSWTVLEAEEKVVWNPDFCKGCLVCVVECTEKALDSADELDFPDGVIRLEKPF